MADENETARTSLIFDASGAQKGAAEFVRAGEQVLAALKAVQAEAEKTANAVGQAETKKAASRRSGSRAAKEAADIEKAAAEAGAQAVVTAGDRVVKSTSAQTA